MTKISKAARHLAALGLKVGDDAIHAVMVPSGYDGEAWHYNRRQYPVRITGIGESVVIVRRKGCMEFAAPANELSAFNKQKAPPRLPETAKLGSVPR